MPQFWAGLLFAWPQFLAWKCQSETSRFWWSTGQPADPKLGTVIWPNNDTVFPITKKKYLSLWNEALASPLSPCGEHGVPPIPRGILHIRTNLKDLSENRVPQILWLTLVVYSTVIISCPAEKAMFPFSDTQINFRQVQIGLFENKAPQQFDTIWWWTAP